MGGRRRGAHDENYSFVSPVVKYLLFLFNLIFWVISLVMVAIGVYARMMKHAEAALRCLSVDPAVMLLVVGVLMFILTFCGCVGSLRENICLLQTFCICLTVIFLLQLVAGVLGFVFSDKARNRVTVMINDAIIHYREDIDLQNLIDFGQKEFGCCGGVTYSDWSQNIYFSCKPDNPSRERCSVPFSCCVLNKDENVINTMCGQGMQEMEYMRLETISMSTAASTNWWTGSTATCSSWGGLNVVCSVLQLVGILLSQILISQIKDQIELQNYNLKHSSDPWR
ncbi:Tetraspanin-33 [Dissostichus eleginoides]|uniref:Tetraspanin n=1 Tax=Dissostichus eleginoides TaxID=100907 RepID=A0AAD9CQE7_DISEL|nr:Tetraspanin-33 [Dissostichus eleginoides]